MCVSTGFALQPGGGDRGPTPFRDVPARRAAAQGLAYGSPDAAKKVIGIHGWMDNAATHKNIAPVWAAAGYEFLALDLPGHGRSGQRHIGDTYSASSYAATVMEAANALKWKHFALCSHSMGAGISSMVAGAWPHRVTGLVLLEGIGMNSKEVRGGPLAGVSTAAVRP